MGRDGGGQEGGVEKMRSWKMRPNPVRDDRGLPRKPSLNLLNVASLWALVSQMLPCRSMQEGEASRAVAASERKEVLAPRQEKEARGPVIRLTHPHTHSFQGWVYHLFI